MDSLGVDAYEVRESYVRFKLSEYQPTTGKCLNFRHLQLLVYFCGILTEWNQKQKGYLVTPKFCG